MARNFDRINEEQWAELYGLLSKNGGDFGPNAKWSPHDILEAIKGFVRENDRLPTYAEIKGNALGFSRDTFYRKVGSLKRVAEILGVSEKESESRKKRGRKNKKKLSSAKTSKARMKDEESIIVHQEDSDAIQRKKDDYIIACITVLEAKGYPVSYEILETGIRTLLNEFDREFICSVWGSVPKFVDTSHGLTTAVQTPMLDTEDELTACDEGEGDNDIEETAFEEGTAPFWEETGEVITPPNKVFTSKSSTSVNNVVKITIEVSRDTNITKIIESVLSFTDNVVIKVVD